MIYVIVGCLVAFLLLYFAEENQYLREWEKFQRDHNCNKK